MGVYGGAVAGSSFFGWWYGVCGWGEFDGMLFPFSVCDLMMTGNAFLLLDDGYTRPLLFMIMYMRSLLNRGGRGIGKIGYLATKLHFGLVPFQLHLLLSLPWCATRGNGRAQIGPGKMTTGSR